MTTREARNRSDADQPTVPIQVTLSRPRGAFMPPGEGTASESRWVRSAGSQSARPIVWLGAYSAGGLALPPAQPTRRQMYAPRGVWLDDQHLIVCDSGNHRVLIWNGLPHSDGQPADVVLGQRDFESEGPGCGSGDTRCGMYLPTGVIVVDGRLLVADAWHHRILVWREIPQRSATPADYAIGQTSPDEVAPNRGRGGASLDSLYWPYGLAYIDGMLWVADTGNRRVMGWFGLPEVDRPADVCLGQPDGQSSDENRGGPPRADSFRWPHDVTGDSNGLWVADAGNHRVLGWRGPVRSDRSADYLLGQTDMTEAVEWPYAEQSERRLRFPYAVSKKGDVLAVADTANNRILLWDLPLEENRFAAASHVLGQLDFQSFGENRWTAVASDTLCWPYGLSLHRDRLAIADSGNNRVMIWDVSAIMADADDHPLKSMADATR